jgi:hypothetical protein
MRKFILKYLLRFTTRNVYDVHTMQMMTLIDWYVFNGLIIITRVCSAEFVELYLKNHAKKNNKPLNNKIV